MDPDRQLPREGMVTGWGALCFGDTGATAAHQLAPGSPAPGPRDFLGTQPGVLCISSFSSQCSGWVLPHPCLVTKHRQVSAVCLNLGAGIG